MRDAPIHDKRCPAALNLSDPCNCGETPNTEFALIEKAALRVGMKSLMNHGAGSCVYSEGCHGVTQEHLVAFAREVALHCAIALSTPPTPEAEPVQQDTVTHSDKTFAYWVYVPEEQRGEFVHDLEDAVDDLTNCECEVTKLYAPAEPVQQDTPMSMEHPNSRLLFKRMVAYFGIELGKDSIAEALAKIATPPAEKQAAATWTPDQVEQVEKEAESMLGKLQASPQATSGEASHSDSQTRALEMVSAFTKVLEAIPAKTDTSGRSDPLYAVACALVRAHKKGSISLVQRHLRIGYNRAAMLLEAMVGDVITEMPPTSKMLAARLPGDGDKGEAAS